MEQMANKDISGGTEMSSATMGAAKKEGKGMMIGMICCAILAAGGIGFGIYEMSQVKTAKQQISDMKIEVKNNDGSTTTLETDKIEVKEETKTVTITDSGISTTNPIINSGGKDLSVKFQTTEFHYEGEKIIQVWITDGTPTCTIMELKKDSYGMLMKQAIDGCQITGLSGKVYNVYEAGDTQMMWPYIAFLMEDGSVEYALTEKILEENSISIQGKFKIEKPVSNIINNVSIHYSVGGGHLTTIFVHPDGSQTAFDHSTMPVE